MVREHRIESRFRALFLGTEELAEIAAEWNALPDGERASLSLEWDHLMADYLTELDEYYRADRMTPEQRMRYQELCRRLKAAAPLIEKLDFYRPPVALDLEAA